MTKLLFLLLLIVVGCQPLPQRDLGAAYTYELELLGGDDTMQYEDDIIKAIFEINEKNIGITLKNKNSSAIKLLWNDASIVSEGRSYKTIHGGVAYADRYSEQTTVTIPPNAIIEDVALPADNVYYSPGFYSQYFSRESEWVARDLLPAHDYRNATLARMILELEGKVLSLFLPIVANNKTTEYSFDFLIKNVRQKTKLPPLSNDKDDDTGPIFIALATVVVVAAGFIFLAPK